MRTFAQKHEELKDEVIGKILKLIRSKGKESKHISERVLFVKDEQQFNLEGGRYLTEIALNELIDNKGYCYFYSVLSLEQLCEIADSFKTKK